MKIINFGSINIDHVYRVDHFVRPGETLQSESYSVFSGGKGANQSISLARAGAEVIHAGKIGKEGRWIKEKLRESGVDTSLIETADLPTGHAVIQVNAEGENAIIIHGGANRSFSDADIEKVLNRAHSDDYLLLQNEINGLEKILPRAKEKGLRIVFNPSPISSEIKSYPLELVDLFIINEVEGKALTGKSRPDEMLNLMQKLYPKSRTVLTLGREGLLYAEGSKRINLPALKVEAVDTTGAGDTFTGYFLAGVVRGEEIERCLQRGIEASALCVTRKGAADSIPWADELAL